MNSRIKTVLQDFVNARTWQEARQILLEQEDIILAETADEVFVSWLTEVHLDQVPLLLQYRDILHRCKKDGINATFDNLPISRPINKALKVFTETTPLFFEIPAFLKDYPECNTQVFQQAIEHLIYQLQSENADLAAELIFALGILRMAQRALFLEEEHTKVLLEWLQANTEESKRLLEQNAVSLLSDQTLEALDKLIELSKADERADITNHQLRRKAILELARSSGIEEAYAQARRPASFVEVMNTLPEEIRSAVEELFEANSPSQLVTLVNENPILLTQELLTSLDTVLEAVRDTGQEKIARAIKQRYEMLKQMVATKVESRPFDTFLEALPEDLRLPIQTFLSVENGVDLNNVLLQYPVLATPLGTSSIEELITELRKSKHEPTLLHVTSRYSGLKQLITLDELFYKATHTIPDALQKVIRNFFYANDQDELFEQVQRNPVLFTSKMLNVIDEILADMRQAGLYDFAHSFEFRYNGLKEIADQQPELSNCLNMVSDDLLAPLNALFAMRTIDDVAQVLLLYPTLLSDEVENLINRLISDWHGVGQNDLANKLEMVFLGFKKTSSNAVIIRSLPSLDTVSLVEKINDTNKGIRQISLNILVERANQGDFEALKGIFNGVRNPSWHLRMLSLDALIRIDENSPLKHLQKIEATSQDRLTRSAAIIALSFINETIVESRPDILKDEDIVLRLAGVICFEMINHRDGTNTFKESLADDDIIVRTVAQEVFASL